MANLPNSPNIEGVWHLESYVRDGQATSVTGIFILTDGQWSTLYFVPQAQSGQYWGSAESGRYQVQGDCLTFHHELTFQGGGGKPLLIDLASTTVEAFRLTINDGSLTIDFPSGSVIHCRRHSP